MDKSDAQSVLSNIHGFFTKKISPGITGDGDAQVDALRSPLHVFHRTNPPSYDKKLMKSFQPQSVLDINVLVPTQIINHRITESFRLHKTSNTTESNL